MSGFRKLEIFQEQIELSTLDFSHRRGNRISGRLSTMSCAKLSPSDQEAFRQQYESALKQAQMRDPLSISRADVLYAFGRK